MSLQQKRCKLMLIVVGKEKKRKGVLKREIKNLTPPRSARRGEKRSKCEKKGGHWGDQLNETACLKG